jgi:PTH1 family peptidyl-tRNA hydrolase
MTSKIKMVVGLGNPGKTYAATRHNIGRRVAEVLEDDLPRGVAAWWPDSFMNVCGAPIAAKMRKKGLAPEEILIISDDFELPLGSLRLRLKGSSGGHKGLQSLIDALGTANFPRLRVGIGPVPKGQDPADFVLKPFAAGEKSKVDEAIVRGVEAVQVAVREGIETAMNRYNIVRHSGESRNPRG